jgi:hypothetical protein
MRRLIPRAALALGAAALCGCYTIRYHRHLEAEAEPVSSWHHNMVAGLIDASGPVNLDTLCPRGFARVESEVTFVNGLAGILVNATYQVVAPALVTKKNEERSGLGYALSQVPLWSPSTVRVWCAKAGASVPREKPLSIAVIALAAKTGIEPKTAELYTDALVGELRRHPRVRVVSPSEIAAAIGLERQKQLLGCTETSCLAEIGGALGADRLVSGSLGRLGGSLVVNLSSVDARTARPVASVSERLQGGDERFLDALPGFADRLLREEPR